MPLLTLLLKTENKSTAKIMIEKTDPLSCIMDSMSQYSRLLSKILHGLSDANINFDDLCELLHHLRFEERIRGSHHIFYQENIEEIINLQPSGSKAKPYQVKQIRKIILKYHLGEIDDQV